MNFNEETISSFCHEGGCVSVTLTRGEVLVRDAKHPMLSPTLQFTHEEWAAFVKGVKAGEFDGPIINTGESA